MDPRGALGFLLALPKLSIKSLIMPMGRVCTTKIMEPHLRGQTMLPKYDLKAQSLMDPPGFGLGHLKPNKNLGATASWPHHTPKTWFQSIVPQGSLRLFCIGSLQTCQQITYHANGESLQHKNHGSTASWGHHAAKFQSLGPHGPSGFCIGSPQTHIWMAFHIYGHIKLCLNHLLAPPWHKNMNLKSGCLIDTHDIYVGSLQNSTSNPTSQPVLQAVGQYTLFCDTTIVQELQWRQRFSCTPLVHAQPSQLGGSCSLRLFWVKKGALKKTEAHPPLSVWYQSKFSPCFFPTGSLQLLSCCRFLWQSCASQSCLALRTDWNSFWFGLYLDRVLSD